MSKEPTPLPVADNPHERVAVPTAVGQTLRSFGERRQRLDADAAAYLQGVCDALGIDLTRVLMVDDEQPALLLRPADTGPPESHTE